MKLPRFLAIAALFILSNAARADVDVEALRKLAPLPRISLGLMVPFGSFGLTGGPEKRPARIRELAARVKRSPRDGAARLELARLYADANESAKAKREATAAVPLLKARSAARPNDARLVTMLGDALVRADRPGEALTLLRKATERLPRDRYAWSVRAVAAQARMPGVLVGMSASAASGGLDALIPMMAAIKTKKPAPAAVAEAEALLREAGASLDMAVKSAPKSVRPYNERAAFRIMNALWTAMLKGDAESTPSMGLALMAPAREDLWQIARLTPNDLHAWLSPFLLEIIVAFAEHGDEMSGKSQEGAWQVMADDAKARCREAIAGVKRLSEGNDSAKAAEAAEELGKLDFFTGDMKAAESALRRAIALAPGRSSAYEALVGIHGQAKRWGHAVQVARQGVRNRDSARGRLILAKALDKSGDRNAAAIEVRAGVQRYPQDLMLSLAGIVIDLRQPQTPAGLSDIGIRLAMLEAKAGKNASSELQEGIAVTRAVHLGLQGKGEEAKAILDKVLEKEPDEETLKALAEAVGG